MCVCVCVCVCVEGGDYVGVGQWRDGLLIALSLQLEESCSCREGESTELR